MKTKTIKGWIEIFREKGKNDTPIIMYRKPIARELANSKEFGYDVYECKIKLGKKL